MVVDLDTPKPGETAPERWTTLGICSGVGVLRALARQHDTTVTPTYAVTTPSGGWHLYYTAPPEAQLRNTHAAIGWKIDGVSKATFSAEDQHAWRRLMRWIRAKYQGRHRLGMAQLRRRFCDTGWRFAHNGSSSPAQPASR